MVYVGKWQRFSFFQLQKWFLFGKSPTACMHTLVKYTNNDLNGINKLLLTIINMNSMCTRKKSQQKKGILNIEMCTFKLHRINDYQFKVVHIPRVHDVVVVVAFFSFARLALVVDFKTMPFGVHTYVSAKRVQHGIKIYRRHFFCR